MLSEEGQYDQNDPNEEGGYEDLEEYEEEPVDGGY